MAKRYIDLAKSCLDLNKNENYDDGSLREVAYYVAGKIVISSILFLEIPNLISIKNFNLEESFSFSKKLLNKQWFSLKIMQDSVISTLSGIATCVALLESANICADSDIGVAVNLLQTFIQNYSTFEIQNNNLSKSAYELMYKDYLVAKIKRYYKKAKALVVKNQDFLEMVASILMENQEISSDELEKIKSKFEIFY